MTDTALSHEELEAARFAVDPRTGRPAIENPTYRRDLFLAQVNRAELDAAAAAAKPAPIPNTEALAVLTEFQGWIDPRTGRRAYTDAGPMGQEVRARVEAWRERALAGGAIPPDVIAATRRVAADAEAEAKAATAKREAAELQQHRLRERGC